MSSNSPGHDDASIPDDEPFIRRIKRVPDCLVPNLVTKEYDLGGNALRFDDDGMSVHSRPLLEAEGVQPDAMFDWSTHTAIEFVAGAVRAGGGGIVRDPVDDPPVGHAHALVETPSATRTERRAVKKMITAHYKFLREEVPPAS